MLHLLLYLIIVTGLPLEPGKGALGYTPPPGVVGI